MDNQNKIYDRPIMVDPPAGWKYIGPDGLAFPKLYDPTKEQVPLLQWLVKQGYPQSEIDRMGSFFRCRFWYPD